MKLTKHKDSKVMATPVRAPAHYSQNSFCNRKPNRIISKQLGRTVAKPRIPPRAKHIQDGNKEEPAVLGNDSRQSGG